MKKVTTPLFNKAGLGKYVVDIGKNGLVYLELRKGFVLDNVIVDPKDTVMDIYYGNQNSLIYSFYNPANRSAININASIAEDHDNVFNKLKSDPTDPIWRQYFVRQALEEFTNQEKPKTRTRDLMTADQLADYLQVKVKTINNWTSEGKIPYRKAGKLPRYAKAEIDAWLESTKRKKIRS